jgi:hypothetical protein
MAKHELNEDGKECLKRINGILSYLERSKKDLLAGKPLDVEDAYAELNELHEKLDEGELLPGKTKEEIERVANELYYSNGVNLSDPCREAYDEAYQLYPKYNDCGDDTDNAQEYIVDRLMESMEDDKKHNGIKGWGESDLQRVRDELSEMVYAGLT